MQPTHRATYRTFDCLGDAFTYLVGGGIFTAIAVYALQFTGSFDVQQIFIGLFGLFGLVLLFIGLTTAMNYFVGFVEVKEDGMTARTWRGHRRILFSEIGRVDDFTPERWDTSAMDIRTPSGRLTIKSTISGYDGLREILLEVCRERDIPWKKVDWFRDIGERVKGRKL